MSCENFSRVAFEKTDWFQRLHYNLTITLLLVILNMPTKTKNKALV